MHTIAGTPCPCRATRVASEGVLTGVWCVPGFGAGFEIALEPSKLRKEGENPGKGHFYFLRQTLVCTKPWFKRDLIAADFLGFYSVFQIYIRCRASPPKNFGVAPPPPVPGGVAPKFGSEKVSRYTRVSQLQLRVSRYTVQLRYWRKFKGQHD